MSRSLRNLKLTTVPPCLNRLSTGLKTQTAPTTTPGSCVLRIQQAGMNLIATSTTSGALRTTDKSKTKLTGEREKEQRGACNQRTLEKLQGCAERNESSHVERDARQSETNKNRSKSDTIITMMRINNSFRGV